MKKMLIVLLPGLFLISCSKNGGFPDTLQITLESISTNQVHLQDSLVVSIGFKDGSADALDSVFFRENNTTLYSGFLSKAIPSFPTKTDEQGNIILTLNYVSDIGQPNNPNGQPDTSAFSFFVKDQAGISSDTVQTTPIIIFQD